MRTLYALAPIDGEDSLDNPLPLLSYLDREIWADMYGFKGFYLISTYGNVISNHHTLEFRKSVAWSHDKQTYRVRLHIDGRKYERSLARVLKMTFDPVPNMRQKYVTFKNGNPRNVTLNNLVWRDAITGKLCEADVIAIRSTPHAKYITRELAARYGVSKETIEDVLSYKTWRRVRDVVK